MASGRAAYVYGDDGGDGWVTPERYELLEADGFSGRAEPSATDFEALRADLDAYDPAIGPGGPRARAGPRRAAPRAGADRAFDDVKPRREPVDAPLRELARIVRVEAATARRAEAVAGEAAVIQARAEALERELVEARSERALADRVAELERALEGSRARRTPSREKLVADAACSAVRESPLI